MISDNMLLLHGNNCYHAKEREYQGTDIVAENTYRAELGLHLYGRSWQETTTGAQLLNWKTIYDRGVCTVVTANNGYDITISANITETSRKYINAEAPLPDTFAGKTITWSYATWESNVPQENAKLGVRYNIDGKTYFSKAQTVTIPENATNILFRLFLIEDTVKTVPVGTYTVKYTGVMLNYGDTALSWEPYTGGMPSPNPDYPQPINSIGDSGSVDVVVTGKNLIPTNLAQVGIFYNADTKRWKFEALSKYGLINVRIIDPNRGSCILPAGQYTLTVIGSQNMQYISISSIGNKNDWKVLLTLGETKPLDTFTLTEDTRIGLFVAPIDTTQTGYIQIQLERGATATSYQPYREPQTLTINTPNGLCGIPVDTGGNYTDSTGQQWICDEVDLERGVKVQRVYQVDIDGENTKFEQLNVYVNLMPSGLPIAMIFGGQRTYAISTFTGLSWFYNSNAQFLYLIADNISDQLNTSCKKQLGKVYYALATPIETPLTAAELAAYKAIKSYPHYTRIESAAELRVKLKIF